MKVGLPHQVETVAQALGLRPEARILVLGDPAADLCAALASHGYRVDCCPDLQRTRRSRHVNIIAQDIAELLDYAAPWELVIGVDGFRRIQQTHTLTSLDHLLCWLAGQTTAAILEAPRTPLAPDLHDLGPYRVEELLTSFAFVSELEGGNPRQQEACRPLVLASNQGMLHEGEWIPRESLSTLGLSTPADESTVRTYRLQPTSIRPEAAVKIECASSDYFERCEASAEALFLQSVDARVRQALGLPRLRSWHHGRAVSTVIRDWVPGVPLTSADCRTGRISTSDVIGCASEWAQVGLFHNDLRPWNLLWNGSSVTAIDYAEASSWDNDVQDLPQILALAGTLAALVTEDIPWGSAFLAAVLDTAAHAGIFDRWPVESQLHAPWLNLPQSAEDVALAVSCLSTPTAQDVMSTVVDTLMTTGPAVLNG